MQTQIKLRKIINEKDCGSAEGLLSSLAAVLDTMAHSIPEDGRIHEIQVKKLDGNTIDQCSESCGIDAFGRKKTHTNGCRKGEPNNERRFLVLASVSTGDESGEMDDDDDV